MEDAFNIRIPYEMQFTYMAMGEAGLLEGGVGAFRHVNFSKLATRIMQLKDMTHEAKELDAQEQRARLPEPAADTSGTVLGGDKGKEKSLEWQRMKEKQRLKEKMKRKMKKKLLKKQKRVLAKEQEEQQKAKELAASKEVQLAATRKRAIDPTEKAAQQGPSKRQQQEQASSSPAARARLLEVARHACQLNREKQAGPSGLVPSCFLLILINPS